MEENQNSEQFNVTNGKKPKKKMGPIKGLFLALLIVFLMCVVALLVRMVIAGDGDYFKPIKDICGIEGENEGKKSSNKAELPEKEEKKKDKVAASGRYALLSEDVDGEDVKHYRLTVDVEDFFGKFMEEMDTILEDYDEEYYDNYDNSNKSPLNLEQPLDLTFDEDFEPTEDAATSDVYGDLMGSALAMVEELSDLMAGEMYIDIYFEGNELVQIVVGYDYLDLLENMYNYLLEEDEDALEEEGIESVEDFAELVKEQFDEVLDKDLLYEMLLESEEGVEESLNQMGFKEKDFKAAFDFNNDTGLVEIYINGTTKVRGLVSLLLDGGYLEEDLKTLEEETGAKIDRDNIIESILILSNEDEENEMFGLEFVEVK